MAYFLRLSDAIDSVFLGSESSPVGVDLIGDFRIEFKVDTSVGATVAPIFGDFAATSHGLLLRSNGNCRFRISGVNTITGSVGLGVVEGFIERENNVVTWSFGANAGSTTRAGTLRINNFGRYNGSTTGAFDLYYIRIFDSGVKIHDYNKQTINGPNDTVLPDTVGGNDGTLVNFPTDNSQWVFYDDGGGTGVIADSAFSVSAPTFSGSASATLPQPVVDVSYSVSIPTVSASVDASLPQPTSDIAFAVNTPSVSASASATIPGYNASVSFSVSAPTVAASASATLPSPIASVGYTVSAPSFNASASASLPQPDSGITFTVNAPSISATASATQTGYNADVAFTVNAPSVSISASATLPQPNTAVSFAVSPPQVSVVAIVGGIAIIVDEETNINQRVLSNNINAPILSNNING